MTARVPPVRGRAQAALAHLSGNLIRKSFRCLESRVDPGKFCCSQYFFGSTDLENRKGYPFASTAEANIYSWNADTSGTDVIPNATIGNDQRPRWEIPPRW